MEIQKFGDFVLNEARTNKKELIEEITDMLKNKPHVEIKNLSDERGIYSMAGIKKYLSKYPSLAVNQAFNDIQNDKKSGLKVIHVSVNLWNEKLPYWYMDLTEKEAEKLKKEYEAEEKMKNEEEINKRSESKKASTIAAAAKVKEKKVAKKAAKKASGEGVERKEGSAPKKRTTKTKSK